MKNKDKIFIPESDYGLAEIHKRDGKFYVYLIPMYGGEPDLDFVDSNSTLATLYVKGIC